MAGGRGQGAFFGPSPWAGLLGPLAVTMAVSWEAGQGGAPLQALCLDALGCLCGCALVSSCEDSQPQVLHSTASELLYDHVVVYM